MTTSFTTTEEFGTEMEGDFDEGSQHPSAFGITFTPQVTGIAIGVGSFLIAAYLFWSQVLPVLSELSTLKDTKKQNEDKVAQLEGLKVESQLQNKKSEFKRVEQVKQEVLNLFANPNTLDTLLISVNTFVNTTNVQLNKFVPGENKVIEDESFGELAIGKIQSQNYDLDFEGTFAQIQLFLQDIERLQPLLVVSNFNSQLKEEQKFRLENKQIVADNQPILQATVTLKAISVAPPPPPEEETEGETKK